MSLKAQVEALIYAAEEPITLDQLSLLLRDAVLAERAAARENQAIEQFGDAPWESTLLPELDSSWEELNGLEPGPLMPQLVPEAAEAECLPESESFVEDDEPFFATEAALPELCPAEASSMEAFPVGVSEAASSAPATVDAAGVAAPETTARKRQPKKSEQEIADDKAVRARLREILAELMADYSSEERGMEIRQVAGGFRLATKPQHHDLVRAFAKSLKPPIRLSLAALETLAVIAYKQPVTAPEIAEIRGVESASVLGTLLDRKLITTAGRKQVIGRPMQYKTSKDFLLRFGLNNVNELPSMEEFSQFALESAIEDTATEVSPSEAAHAPAVNSAEAGAGESAANPSESVEEPGAVPETGSSLDQ